eukprot:Nk52_evm1s459 gene=Nk52_evmTU1s459
MKRQALYGILLLSALLVMVAAHAVPATRERLQRVASSARGNGRAPEQCRVKCESHKGKYTSVDLMNTYHKTAFSCNYRDMEPDLTHCKNWCENECMNELHRYGGGKCICHYKVDP